MTSARTQFRPATWIGLAVVGLASPATGQVLNVPDPDPNSPFLPIEVIAEAVDPTTRNRYQLLSMVDYLNAYHYAVDNGAMLWEINTEAEQNFVLDSFREPAALWREEFIIPAGFNGAGTALSGSGNLYIGFTDSEFFGATEDVSGGDQFQWISGAPVTYTPAGWGQGEPNDFDTGEDYTEVSFGGSWNDDNDRESGLDLGLDGLPETAFDPENRRLPGGGNLTVIELPPIPLPADLIVDPVTGYAEIVPNADFLAFGDPGSELTVRSYELTANEGVLTDGSWGATNLSSRLGPPSGPGESWEVIYSDGLQLLEAFLLGGTAVADGESLFLGQIARPLGESETVESTGLNFAMVVDSLTSNGTQTELSLDITFAPVTAPADFDFNPGDYNADGTVDGADYSVWRDTAGQTGADLAADGNGDSIVDEADYAIWADNFGRVLSAATATPEPTSLALVAGFALAAVCQRR